MEVKKANNTLYILHKNDKPLDVLADLQDLGNCDESKICYWVMQIVFSVSMIMQRDLNIDFQKDLSKGDAEIQTFEDRYLECLMELYNLSQTRKTMSQQEKKKKKYE